MFIIQTIICNQSEKNVGEMRGKDHVSYPSESSDDYDEEEEKVAELTSSNTSTAIRSSQMRNYTVSSLAR